jgi:antitoxin PrlF
MKENIIISERGQITLPSKIRKKLGLEPGSIVTIEERERELVIRPAAVVEIDVYSDEEIESWLEEDKLPSKEKKAIHKKLGLSS